MFRIDEVAHLIMYADGVTTLDVVNPHQPLHIDEHEMEEVDGRTLNDPIYATCHELEDEKALFYNVRKLKADMRRKLTWSPITAGSNAWLIWHPRTGVFGQSDFAMASSLLNISDSLQAREQKNKM